MKKLLLNTFKLLSLFSICTVSSINVNAQPDIYDGLPYDSTVISFEANDMFYQNTNVFTIGSTPNDSLWQIGTTSKTFFTTGGFTDRGIMTDSTNYYPVNANSSFMFKTKGYYGFNFIVTFTHKYQTATGMDGGIIEFSIDSGATWNNVRGECTRGSGFEGSSVWLSNNFYDSTDTVYTGEPAFTGESNGWLTSRFQFFYGLPILTTGPSYCVAPDPWIRFRFVSDSTADTLAGWMIDDIKLERDHYSSIEKVDNNKRFEVYPNPSSGLFNFPDIPKQEEYTIEVYDLTGRQVIHTPYTNYLNMRDFERGIYLYRVSDGEHLHTGRMVIQ